MENILPSWDFGTHLDRIEVVGVPRLPLVIIKIKHFSLAKLAGLLHLSPDMSKPKYMCQPLVANAKTSSSSIPLILPNIAMIQSWTCR